MFDRRPHPTRVEELTSIRRRIALSVDGADGSADAAAASAAVGSVGGTVAASFDVAFEQFLTGVGAVRSSGVPADARSLVAMRGQLDALHALVAEAEVRFDAAELWRDEGAGSLRAWEIDACGLPAKEAGAVARRVSRLSAWPEVAAAWRDGVVSGAQVDQIVAAVPNRFVGVFAEQAADVVKVLAPLDAAGTRFAMGRWVRCAEAVADGGVAPEHPSGLSVDSLLDGRVAVAGEFTSADAAIVEAALRVFDVPDPVDDQGQVIGEPRSLRQRRADALVAVCKFGLAHREGASASGRFLPHVSLIVEASQLAGAVAGDHRASAVTSDGSVLTATAVATLSCDSVVQRVLTADGVLLDMGREVRTATSAQRRAVIARDRHCRAPGCRTGPKHCDVHHIHHWINGGRTDLGNLVLLCGTHHRLFHRPGHRLELDDHAVFTVRAPSGRVRSTVPDRPDQFAGFDGFAGADGFDGFAGADRRDVDRYVRSVR